jgi:hypothetical protein
MKVTFLYTVWIDDNRKDVIYYYGKRNFCGIIRSLITVTSFVLFTVHKKELDEYAVMVHKMIIVFRVQVLPVL